MPCGGSQIDAPPTFQQLITASQSPNEFGFLVRRLHRPRRFDVAIGSAGIARVVLALDLVLDVLRGPLLKQNGRFDIDLGQQNGPAEPRITPSTTQSRKRWADLFFRSKPYQGCPLYTYLGHWPREASASRAILPERGKRRLVAATVAEVACGAARSTARAGTRTAAVPALFSFQCGLGNNVAQAAGSCYRGDRHVKIQSMSRRRTARRISGRDRAHQSRSPSWPSF